MFVKGLKIFGFFFTAWEIECFTMAFMRTAVSSTSSMLIILLLLISGCARMPNLEKTTLKPKSLGELEGYVLNNKPALDLFRLSGPFEVERQDDREILLSGTQRIVADLFMAVHAEKAPLLIFLHGHGASREAHAYQALHAASWGLHGLTVQLPAEGPWVDNGKTLARIVEHIHRRPEALSARIDVSRIILVGHSFGGVAVAVALAEKARVTGGILLDPAGESSEVPGYLLRIDTPVLVLGADERVSAAVNRDFFFRFIRGRVAELSITDASHEDAQFPAEGGNTTEAVQITFAAAITSASFSLALTRRFEQAWASFQEDFRNGKFIRGRNKGN
jgi:pimeloyl-ACP methyl ester carboxylesterase